MANQDVLDAAADAKVMDARTRALLTLAGNAADFQVPQGGES